MSIAENIKKVREIFDLTQSDLAEIAGVSENAVSKWENGYAKPRMGAIERIANKYGLEKFHLLEDGGMDTIDPVRRKAVTKTYIEVGAYSAYRPGEQFGSEMPDFGFPCPPEIYFNHRDAFFIYLDSNSSGELPSGCFALIDPRFQYPLILNELYAVWGDDGQLCIKRARNGSSIEHSHFGSLIGKVVWYSAHIYYEPPIAKPDSSNLSSDEVELVGYYRRMADEDKAGFITTARGLAYAGDAKKAGARELAEMAGG